ncbi:MAG: helix-hairpin-helix domain-containing protein [Prevotella sp.]|nr:helix-hairpin-helix domain-containing protein [Prevotella sp.]
MFKEFFYFPKSDRKGILAALLVATAAIVGVWLVGGSNNSTAEEETIARVEGEGSEGEKKEESRYYATEERVVHLQPFDPNLADSTQLLDLGLQPWQVRSIYRYRAKGGVFRQPEDFARVYGLTVKQYRELEPYIRISPEYRPAADVYGKRRPSARQAYGDGGAYTAMEGGTPRRGRTVESTPTYSRDTLRFPVKLRVGETVDLNTSDTTMLKKVPGIGSYYAKKVVAYRERLGGFCSTDQLMEIEGFPEEAAGFFILNPSNVRRLNVNKLSLAQLRQHPYINFYMAKAITDRRRLKGPLHSLEELSLLPDFTPEVVRRLAPYVEF